MHAFHRPLVKWGRNARGKFCGGWLVQLAIPNKSLRFYLTHTDFRSLISTPEKRASKQRGIAIGTCVRGGIRGSLGGNARFCGNAASTIHHQNQIGTGARHGELEHTPLGCGVWAPPQNKNKRAIGPHLAALERGHATLHNGLPGGFGFDVGIPARVMCQCRHVAGAGS